MNDLLVEQIFRAKFEDDVTVPVNKMIDSVSKSYDIFFKCMVSNLESVIQQVSLAGDSLKLLQGAGSVNVTVPSTPSLSTLSLNDFGAEMRLMTNAIVDLTIEMAKITGGQIVQPKSAATAVVKESPKESAAVKEYRQDQTKHPIMSKIWGGIGTLMAPIRKKDFSSMTIAEKDAARQGLGKEELAKFTDMFTFKFGGMFKNLIGGRILGGALGLLSNIAAPLFLPIQEFLMNLAIQAQPLVQMLLPKIQEFFTNLTLKLKPFIDNIIPKIENFLKNKSLGEMFMALPMSVKLIGGFVLGLYGFINVVAPVIGVIKGISSVLGLIIPGFSLFKTVLMPLAQLLGGGLATALKLIILVGEGLVAVITSPVGMAVAIGAASYAIGKFADDLFGFSDRIGSWLSKQTWFKAMVGADNEFSRGEQVTRDRTKAERLQQQSTWSSYIQPEAPSIPMDSYAKGGLVSKTGPAYIHAGETVIPKGGRYLDPTTVEINRQILTSLQSIGTIISRFATGYASGAFDSSPMEIPVRDILRRAT